MLTIRQVIEAQPLLQKGPVDGLALVELDQGIKGLLGGQLAAHCQIGQITGQVLTYYVDSPLWAHTFRMMKASVLGMIQLAAKDHHQTQSRHLQLLKDIRDIQVKVRPIPPPKALPRPRPPLAKFSNSTASLIESTADSFEDAELAAIWAEFGRRHCVLTND